MSPERRPLFTINRNGVHVRRITQAGGSADDGTAAIAGQRAEDPLLARTGGTVGVSRVPRGTQLPLEHGPGDLGTRRSAGSVRSICRKISELTQARYGSLDGGEMVERLDRVILGWAN